MKKTLMGLVILLILIVFNYNTIFSQDAPYVLHLSTDASKYSGMDRKERVMLQLKEAIKSGKIRAPDRSEKHVLTEEKKEDTIRINSEVNRKKSDKIRKRMKKDDNLKKEPLVINLAEERNRKKEATREERRKELIQRKEGLTAEEEKVLRKEIFNKNLKRRRDAIRKLGFNGNHNNKNLRYLLKAANKKDKILSEELSLITAIAQFDDKRSSAYLLRILKKEKTLSKYLKAAFRGIYEKDSPEWITPLIKKYNKTDDIEIQGEILSKFRRIQNEKTYKILFKVVVHSNSSYLKRIAINSIDDYNEYDFLPVLIIATNDSDRSVRETALYSIGIAGRPGAEEFLLKTLEDKDALIRCVAAYGLGAMKRPDGLEVVLKEVDNEDVEVRKTVVAAIGRISVVNEGVLEAMKLLIKDEYEVVKKRAEDVLKKLARYSSTMKDSPEGIEMILAMIKNGMSENNDVGGAAPSPEQVLFDNNTLAVVGFKAVEISAEEAVFMSDFFRQDLVMSGKFDVVEKNSMDRVLKEQGFQQTGCTDTSCAVEMGKLLNVGSVVTGSIGKLLGKYHLSIRVIDVETGRIVYSDDERCEKADGFRVLPEKIVERMCSKTK